MSEVIFLGTGTSSGVPMIGCRCPVCLSDHSRNQRTRTSLLIEYRENHILIDTGIDLRRQALREGIDHLEAILFTHTHVDHLFGLDEVRRFNWMGNEQIPVYASRASLEEIERIFPYCFRPPKLHGGIPSLDLIEIQGPFEVCGLAVQPVPIQHGTQPILGFRFRGVAYLTDCSAIPEESMALLEGLDLLILDALQEKPHPTHFSLSEACEVAERLGAGQTLLVHMSHELEHEATNEKLPGHIQLAYDGQRVQFY